MSRGIEGRELRFKNPSLPGNHWLSTLNSQLSTFLFPMLLSHVMPRQLTDCLTVTGMLLLCLISGCNPSVMSSDQQDEKNPYFQKGKAMFQKRDYKQAVKYYQQALDMDSKNAAAHLELGLLYEDKLQDYAYAIYHYRRYLELRPTAEKADLVRQFVDRSQLGLAASVPNSPLVTGEEIARLHQENSNLLAQVESLSLTNQALESKLARLQASPEETRQPIIVQSNFFVVPAVTNQMTSPPRLPATNQTAVAQQNTNQITKPPETTAARTYTVVKGDTLSTISLKMYGRRDKWQVIYNANKAIIGPAPSYKLKPGQALTIPKI